MSQPDIARLAQPAPVTGRPAREFVLWLIAGVAIEAIVFVLAPRLWADLEPRLQLTGSSANPLWNEWPWAAFKFAMLATAGWCVLFRTDLVNMTRAHVRRPPAGMIALHLFCLILLLAPRAKIHGANPAALWGSLMGFSVLLAASAGYFFTLMRLTATQAFWARHHPLRHPVAAITLVAVLLYSMIDWNQSLIGQIQSPLDRQLFAATMALVLPVLHSAGFVAIADSGAHTVAIGDFAVQIAPGCLGYEGWAIAFGLIGGYMFINRRDLVFPRCLAVFPLVAGVLFVCNSLRIAALLAIGASGHADVAVGGFHSTAGSITLFAVIGTALVLLSWLGRPATSPVRLEFDLAGNNMQLLPWLVATSLAVAFGLVYAGVDWWYPARVVIVGALLLRWRSRLGLDSPSNGWLGPAAGALVFALWLALVPHDAVQSGVFEEKLFASSAASAWIVFRVLGASVIVPVVEELAFRGFLLDRAGQFLQARGWLRHAATGGAVVGSALVFGVLHSAWVAGTLAGLAYAAVRLYRGRLADAVLAHATTNLLLSAYVLNTGYWSYW
jgi:exosortase E/protease (VPEID-CTERM system)